MGRGRKGLLYQGQKSIDRKRRNGAYYLFLSAAPCKTKGEPTAPSTLVDRLKQMDPKTLAALLLE